jgi:hypothetical protein
MEDFRAVVCDIRHCGLSQFVRSRTITVRSAFARIQDHATFEKPMRDATGGSQVVNGVEVFVTASTAAPNLGVRYGGSGSIGRYATEDGGIAGVLTLRG